ncbi:MAG: amino acid adenylation domain-containing protein [Candidatus Ancillula sp.]|nr:amino acid adenylation domain-containing protein [Candidatus Ancillula sp.]
MSDTEMNTTTSQNGYFLTPPEEQMLFQKLLNPTSNAYNVRRYFKITGHIDPTKLEAALNAYIAGEPILRSKYAKDVSGKFMHYFEECLRVKLEVVETAGKQPSAEDYDRYNQPFTPQSPALMRFVLFKVSDTESVLYQIFDHIIYDGGGEQQFMDNLWDLYTGAQESIAIHEDFFDYASKSAKILEENCQEGLEYFQKLFEKGIPETTPPSKSTRPEVLPQTNQELKAHFNYSALQALARRHKTTTYTLLVTALFLTTAKLFNTRSVVLGAAMSGRSARGLTDLNNVLGMFVNTLPLRLDLDNDPTLEQVVNAVSMQIVNAKRFELTPFSRIVKALDVETQSGRSTFFDVLVNYLHRLKPYTAEGLRVEQLLLPNQNLEQDMTVEVIHDGDDLEISLQYSDLVYEPEVAKAFIDHYQLVLSRIVEGPESITLSELIALPEEWQTKLIQQFTGHISLDHLDQSIPELFQTAALNYADKLAVVDVNEQLTYSQLDALSTSIANILTKSGVKATDVVGVMVDRSVRMPLFALAVLKVGATYLPLDPAYPADRLMFMLSDANAKVLLQDEVYSAKLPDYAHQILESSALIVDAKKSLEDGAVPELKDLPKPNDRMVMLYTSGTTGNPKGVEMTHRNVITTVAYAQREFEITADDNIASYASFGFDANMLDLYSSLTIGATLYVIPEEIRLNIYKINQFFEQHRVSFAFMTTQLARQFAVSMENTSLRALATGGETLVPLKKLPHFALYNCYGPTECSIFVTCGQVQEYSPRITIGKPNDNVSLTVWDTFGQLALPGTVGELYISGPVVALGYLNRPDITAAAFKDNSESAKLLANANSGTSFVTEDYMRAYRTGDLASLMTDGNIDLVGRNDSQVKVRGFRIELSEIEGRIRLYKGIEDVTVVALDIPGSGKRIAAYIVSDQAISIPDLNAFIAAELPVYMVPSSTMQIPSIPLNQNGKVDKRKLPSIHIKADEIVAPQSDTQAKLLKIAAKILGTEDFGITTDLGLVGMHSLTAIEFATLAQKEMGVELLVPDILRLKTIESLAGKVADKLQNNASHAPESVVKAADLQYFPLSDQQKGVYLDWAKSSTSTSYNIPLVIEYPSKIDPAKLAEAVVNAINGQPILKAHLAKVTDIPEANRSALPFATDFGVLLAKGSETITVADVPVLNAVKNAAGLPDFVEPFDLFTGPNFRAKIVPTDKSTVLLFDAHHIFFDGGSVTPLLEDIRCALGAEAAVIESSDDILQERAAGQVEVYDYFQYLLDQESEQDADKTASDCEYWAKALHNTSNATQLLNQKNTSNDAKNMRRAIIAKDFNISQVDNFCNEHSLSPANFFLGISTLGFAKFSGSNNLLFSVLSNGRYTAKTSRIVGMLVKTLPFALDFDPSSDETVKEFFDRVTKLQSESLEHDSYTLADIACDYHYSLGLNYSYQAAVLAPDDAGKRQGQNFKTSLPSVKLYGEESAKFPLTIHIVYENGNYQLQAGYNPDYYDDEVVNALADTLEQLVQQIISARGSDLAVKALKNVPDVEYQPLVKPKFKNLVQAWEDQVLKSPEKVAVKAADGDYTFTALNARANALAQYLQRTYNIEPRDSVGFMLHRDSNILVTMLAILKLGAAYIPIDPEYPSERIAQITEDSNAKHIVTADDIDATDFSITIPAPHDYEQIAPDDLAYMIFTSGSTGRPKGVMITHENITNHILASVQNRHFAVLKDADAVVLAISTVSFDLALKELFGSVMNGLTVVIADDLEAKDALKLAKLIERSGADAILGTPSRLMQYLESKAFAQSVQNAKVIIAGAEPYPPKLYNILLQLAPNAQLMNTYGPTETTVSSNAKLLGSDDVTVGAPLQNIYEEVVDQFGQMLPHGIIGELIIGGLCVSKGYINSKEQTEKAFFTKRLGGVQGDIPFYRSGDLACMYKSGEVRILGRNDSQIKLRGLRIELGEIEAAAGRMDGVTRALALVKTLGGAEHIALYFTADRFIDLEELKAHMSETLTEYMVPTAYLQLDKFPTTPNGKVDRLHLKDPQILTRATEYTAPSNEIEDAICEIYQKVLKSTDKVGVDDNFFELGGTSLSVTSVTIYANESGLEINYADLFANPTPKLLAKLVKERTNSSTESTEETSESADNPLITADYDYTKIAALLQQNTLANYTSKPTRPIGNILLTGATGYLGIHILQQFLDDYDGKAYLLVRHSEGLSAEQKVKALLEYYFETTYEELFGRRIFVIDGDVTDSAPFAELKDVGINTVFNCAAIVKHFSAGTEIEDINVGGARNCLEFAKSAGARFVQISTASVAGQSINQVPTPDRELFEQELYIGQNIDNQYTHSKFMAERLVLEAAANDGADVKIMRVGNLQARETDGEFQINFESNNFVGQLRAYALIGKVPYSALSGASSFSPIDQCAKAILELSKAAKECTVFHPKNTHFVHFIDIIKIMQEVGIPIEFVEADEFKEAFEKASQDLDVAQKLSPLIAYQKKGAVFLSSNNQFTEQALLRSNFVWNITDNKYLRQLINGLYTLGFFSA